MKLFCKTLAFLPGALALSVVLLAIRAGASDPALIRIGYQKYGTLNVVRGATEAGVADKIKIYSADVSTSDIQDMREKGSPWAATSATNPAVVGEVSLSVSWPS